VELLGSAQIRIFSHAAIAKRLGGSLQNFLDWFNSNLLLINNTMRKDIHDEYEIFSCNCHDPKHFYTVTIGEEGLQFSLASCLDNMPLSWRIKEFFRFITKKSDIINLISLELNDCEHKIFYRVMKQAEKKILKRDYIPRNVEIKTFKKKMIRTDLKERGVQKYLGLRNWIESKIENKRIRSFLKSLWFKLFFNAKCVHSEFFIKEEYYLFQPSEEYGGDDDSQYLMFSVEEEEERGISDINISRVICVTSEDGFFKRWWVAWKYLINHSHMHLADLYDIRVEDIDRFFNVIYKLLKRKYGSSIK
jgi:hypothetical protein